MTQMREEQAAAFGVLELSAPKVPGARTRQVFARNLRALRYPGYERLTAIAALAATESAAAAWRRPRLSPSKGRHHDAWAVREFFVEQLLSVLARRIDAASSEGGDIASALLRRAHGGAHGDGTSVECWSGHVSVVRGDRVHARLSDESGQRPDVEAEFPLEMFEASADRLRPGAAIRWSTTSFRGAAGRSHLQERTLEVLEAPVVTEEDRLRGKVLAHELSGLVD